MTPSRTAPHLAALPNRPVTATFVLAALATLLVTVPAASPARACSCAPPPPPEEAAAEADAVFVGEVAHARTEGGEHDGDLIADIEVERVFAGDVAARVEVRTARHGATCGYGFELGTRELVYARADAEGHFTTSLCSRTSPADTADEDLAALGDGEAPTATEAPSDEQPPDAAAPADASSTTGDGWVVPTAIAVALALLIGAFAWLRGRR